ncbi:MAG: c-type cytochrome [Anaerolineales bacterium]|jgi:mono/diheme cytochrome c family protein|nr:c-type cytochrome [Anaerolineales bacterium]
MKKLQISSRTIEFLVGILATALMVAGIAFYAWSEPVRLQEAQARQLSADLDGAMSIYAQNCAVCHGAAGEGIGAIPALDNPALKEMDAEAITKIIARGLYGSAMPAWSLEDGGPLSDYQIMQLVSLVHYGDWQATQDRVVNLGLAPLIPFVSEADPVILDSLAALLEGDALAAGILLYAENCVACHGADGLGTRLAPALNDPAVQAQSTADLERTLRLGVAGTLMAGWEKALDVEQIATLVDLLLRWDEIPTGAIPAPEKTILVTAESLALGAELYANSCDNCHGPEGQGSQRAPSLNVRSYLVDTPDAALEQIITLGVPETAMPAWGDRLSEAEIQAIVGFIRSWETTAPEVAQPVRVRGPWWQGNTTAGGNVQLPSGGAAVPAATDAAALVTPAPGSGESVPSATPGAGSNAGQHQGGSPGGGTGQGANSPWVTPELPWYQTLDPRAIILAVVVVVIAGAMILAALHGLRRLKTAA